MPSENITLDLGTGEGGAYMADDKKNSILRIALEKCEVSLQYLKRKYNIPVVNADASMNLPFATMSIFGAEIIFPNRNLLYLLEEENSLLWSELQRIIKSNGKITIVMDVPYNRRVATRTGSGISVQAEISETPEKIVANAAKIFGFDCSIKQLTSYEVRKIGTATSDRIFENM